MKPRQPLFCLAFQRFSLTLVQSRCSSNAEFWYAIPAAHINIYDTFPGGVAWRIGTSISWQHPPLWWCTLSRIYEGVCSRISLFGEWWALVTFMF